MRWTPILEQGKTEDEWFNEYVATALASPAPKLPPASQKIGSSTVTWFETEPGLAFVHAIDGTPDDRVLATVLVREALRAHGIRQATYIFDQGDELWGNELRKTADWDEIMAKAKRLIQSNQVQILRNGYNNVVGHVQGDHGDYQTEIGRDDPNSRAITTWQCDCPWDQYAWQRTRQWKKYEGRPCAHVLATYWKALSTPLDEDVNPATGQPNAQMSLFNAPHMAPSAPPGAPPSPFNVQAPGGPVQQMQIPGMFPGQATGTPGTTQPAGPAPNQIIPPFPLDQLQQAQQQVNPASVPGQRQPSPTNPMQWPGGTFSSVQDGWDLQHDWNFDRLEVMSADFNTQPQGFQNGNMISTKYEDWGVWSGKSEDHGAGSPAKIPAGSVGEVLGQDPTTGMVNVLFMGDLTKDHGPLEPYGATAWFLPSEIVERPDVQRPGPAIKRR